MNLSVSEQCTLAGATENGEQKPVKSMQWQSMQYRPRRRYRSYSKSRCRYDCQCLGGEETIEAADIAAHHRIG